MAEFTYAMLLIFVGAFLQWVLSRIGASPPCDQDALEAAQRAAIKANSMVIECQAALLKIARWHGEFPTKDYGWDYGSNGERDYMRQIALNAVAACKPQGGEVK